MSRGGFYFWKGRGKSERAQEEDRLLGKIRQFFLESDQTYGSPRIWQDLREAGFCCGRHRVARLMRQAGMKAAVAPRFVVTTDSRHALPVAQNLLGQDFGAEGANVKWASDITYVWTKEGWLYLSVVLDLFSRKVVGWSMQESLEGSLVVNAPGAAICQRQPDVGLLHHSDRGSQHASGDYQSLLRTQGIVCSMSRRGNCYDNAVVEIFRYIEVCYNRKRRHSSLGYVSPVEFEEKARQRAIHA